MSPFAGNAIIKSNSKGCYIDRKKKKKRKVNSISFLVSIIEIILLGYTLVQLKEKTVVYPIKNEWYPIMKNLDMHIFLINSMRYSFFYSVLPNLKGPKLLPGIITSSILFERGCGCF